VVTGGDDRRRSDKGHFSDALDGVKPLGDRDRHRSPPRGTATVGATRLPTPEFELDESGSGRAMDVAAKILAELRRGRPRAQREIDLHGLDLRGAQSALLEALERARTDDLRCVLVIHGRGLRSESAPVLQAALPGWLTGEPLAHWVMAFARAPVGRGGATLVRLRRAQRRTR
jgi:DNA-nicking Smr family endonuclease